jgi:dTDP-4-dehydrorhamnose reductase
MSGHNSITSLNKIYSHQNSNDSNAQFIVISTAAVKNGTTADFYRETNKFTNAKILNDFPLI